MVIHTTKQALPYILAGFLHLLSVFFWTVIITGGIRGMHPVVAISEVSDPVAALELHSAADDFDQWGLNTAWEISIPALHIKAPVLLPKRTYWDKAQWNLLEQQMQAGMNHGVVAYPHSVTPGKWGAVIIAGHSSPPNSLAEKSPYGSVFADLPNITTGDEIVINTPTGAFTYVVEKSSVVPPENTKVLEQIMYGSELRLITCFPVGTTKDRMVVVAKLKENQ